MTTINPDLMVKFEEALGIFLENGNVEVLNWFVNMEDSYKSNLLHSPEIVKKLWTSSVRNGLNNSSVIQYLATACPKENYDLLVELFSAPIKTKDPNQYSTLLEIFIQKRNEWVTEISNKILNEFIKTALEMGMPNGTQLLDKILNSFPNLSENYLPLISTQASSWVSSNDPNARNAAIQILKLVNQKSQRKILVASQNILDQISILLSANDPTVKNLIEYIISAPKELSAKQENQLIEIMTVNLTSTKPVPILELLLDFSPKIIETLNRYQLLYGIVELSKTVTDENIRNRCFAIIRSNKGLLTTKDEDKIREFFGKDFFKKEDS